MGLFNFLRKKENDYSTIKIKLKKVFEAKPNFTNFGNENVDGESVGIYPEKVFEKVQLGYRVDQNGYKIKSWIGDNYYIIGGYGQLGDVLIVDTADNKLPIFAMQHDNWKKYEQIANSIEDFVKIITLINNSDIYNDEKFNKLINDISLIIKCEFWEDQLLCVKNS